MAGTQQVEEVQPALARRRAEPGEAVVADLRADTVGALVAGAGVVHRDPGGGLQPGAQHIAGFGEEAIMVGDQQAHDLSLGDADADRLQLRHQPRHGDLALIVLPQHEAAELRPEMAADAGWQRGEHHLPIRRHPALAPVAHDLRAQHYVLHQERRISLETRACRRLSLDNPILHADPGRRLAAAAALGALSGRLRLGSLLHAARFDPRSAFLPFQPRNLLALFRDHPL
jgi:hypothetical protein